MAYYRDLETNEVFDLSAEEVNRRIQTGAKLASLHVRDPLLDVGVDENAVGFVRHEDGLGLASANEQDED